MRTLLSGCFRAARRRFHVAVIAAFGLLLACGREVRDPFHVADHARQVIQIVAMACGTCFQIAFVDMPALVADRIGNVERKVVAALGRGHAQQVAVLLLRKVLFEIHV